jgi:hypothetical protein
MTEPRREVGSDSRSSAGYGCQQVTTKQTTIPEGEQWLHKYR